MAFELIVVYKLFVLLGVCCIVLAFEVAPEAFPGTYTPVGNYTPSVSNSSNRERRAKDAILSNTDTITATKKGEKDLILFRFKDDTHDLYPVLDDLFGTPIGLSFGLYPRNNKDGWCVSRTALEAAGFTVTQDPDNIEHYLILPPGGLPAFNEWIEEGKNSEFTHKLELICQEYVWPF